jgi:site-specific DNA-methyltransferase (adenine-specific)
VIGLNRILVGDAASVLRKLPDNFVDCVVTSPPYYRLRDYQQEGQLGLEPHVDGWVESLRQVMQEVQRVLVPTGTVWLNLGDTYSKGTEGAPVKSLLLAPERLSVRLSADGWTIRNRIVWGKKNPMPTSVRDRLGCAHELIYLLAQQKSYFFDLDAIRIPHTSRRSPSRTGRPAWAVPDEWRGPNMGSNGGRYRALGGVSGHPLGKNPTDLWPMATASYRGAHHAVFPVALPARAIQAGCPARRCRRCKAPWKRERYQTKGGVASLGRITPGCACRAGAEPGVVLDPFMGSGTTAIAAEQLNRRWLGIELNPAFAELAGQRINEARAGAARRERTAA